VNEEAPDPLGQVHDFLLEAKPGARETLDTIRSARTAGPGAGAEELRAAYLGLLKLSLCDLGSARTTSVGLTPDRTLASRTLRGEDLRIRAAGLDWPLQGQTMTGLQRLDDLQVCVEKIAGDGVPGDLIEAGAWRGGASILMRATLDTLGEHDRDVYVADSFEGFPVDEDGEHIDLSTYDFLSVPLEEARGNFARLGLEQGVRFVPGFFEDTLPEFADGRWAIARLDGDTYEATMTALNWLYPGLEPGGYLIIDDYGAFDECRRAIDDYRDRHGITEPIEPIDWTGARWRRESDAPIEREPRSAGRRAPAGAPPAANGARRHEVPTVHELELERELAELRERLAAAESTAHRRPRLFRR
jgi:hypothetical protein